jgi:probable rRNA maturation factor
MPDLAAPDVEIIANAPCWDEEPRATEIVSRAIAAVAPLAAEGTVTVVLTDDTEMRILNNDWRGLDKPTNVLSFPAAPIPESMPGGETQLGDIIIAYETVKREAADEGKPFADHLSHLAIHGYLHLIGYDHDTDARAEIMEGLERKALASLGIADPYDDQ